MPNLASLKLTLVGMLALAVGAVLSYQTPTGSPLWIAIPLAVLSVNLLAALIANPRFRRQGGLLVFHIALLAVGLLVGFAQLTSLKARFEIAEGQVFSTALLNVERQGPWHPWSQLRAIRFTQGPIRVQYQPQLIRDETRTSVVTDDGTGIGLPTQFGDNVPLRFDGYRFYSTSNKGYSLVLTWFGDDGVTQTGAINMPSYPLNDWNQRRAWTTPGGTELELKLELSVPVPVERAWVLDSRHAGGELSVITGGHVSTLNTGGTLQLPSGRLRFEAVRMWMGYALFYDPTLPWLFAAGVVGVMGMIWHFWGKLWSRPLPGATDPVESQQHGKRDVVRV